MARPPEPIDEILPHATLVVEATVREVLHTSAPAARPEAPAGWRDVGVQAPEQRLVLDVTRVLRGAHGAATLEVTKPVAPYAVREGVRGAWLIDVSGVVLGRYGPDTWSLARVEAALATRG